MLPGDTFSGELDCIHIGYPAVIPQSHDYRLKTQHDEVQVNMVCRVCSASDEERVSLTPGPLAGYPIVWLLASCQHTVLNDLCFLNPGPAPLDKELLPSMMGLFLISLPSSSFAGLTPVTECGVLQYPAMYVTLFASPFLRLARFSSSSRESHSGARLYH